MDKKHKLVRITTIPASMKVLLRGQLSFMQKNGFEVLAVSADGEEVESLKQQENVSHYAVPFTRLISPIQDLKCLIQLTKYLRKVKPDVVHTHTPKAGLLGMWAAFLAGVPVRLHTIAGVPWIETTGFRRWVLKSVEKITALPATQVYPNSHKQHEFLMENGIANKKFKVLEKGSSNGIDTTHFSITPAIASDASRLRVNENVKEDAWIWIFVGRIVKDKGMEEMLYAWNTIQEKYPNDKLWLLGSEEPELDPLSPEATEFMNNSSSVKKWGFLNDIRPYLAAAQVLVFPSYREGFPNVPMQAGAMECALILSDINGCNEIVEDQKSGILVQSKNKEALLSAMLTLRENESKRIEFAKAARQHIAEGFDQQKIWQAILKEYRNFLSK